MGSKPDPDIGQDKATDEAIFREREADESFRRHEASRGREPQHEPGCPLAAGVPGAVCACGMTVRVREDHEVCGCDSVGYGWPHKPGCLLAPDAPDPLVDTELRALGIDPAELGARGTAFVKLAKENVRLRENASEEYGLRVRVSAERDSLRKDVERLEHEVFMLGTEREKVFAAPRDVGPLSGAIVTQDGELPYAIGGEPGYRKALAQTLKDSRQLRARVDKLENELLEPTAGDFSPVTFRLFEEEGSPDYDDEPLGAGWYWTFDENDRETPWHGPHETREAAADDAWDQGGLERTGAP